MAEDDQRQTNPPQSASTRDEPLYKFRAFDPIRDLDPEWQGYAASLLRDGLIYCASIDDLNDPWEGRTAFVMPDPDTEPLGVKKFFDAFVDGLSPERLEGVEDWYRREGLAVSEAGLQEAYWERSRGIGVYCVAGNATHPLMWSYYSAGHQGFCWVIDNNAAPLSSAVKVGYQQTYPSINWARWEEENIVGATFLTKADYWQHEDEYRFLLPASDVPHLFTVVPHNGRGDVPRGRYLKISPDAVKGVIFGCKMRTEHAREIFRLAQQYGRRLHYSTAHIQTREYQMQVWPHDGEVTARILG